MKVSDVDSLFFESYPPENKIHTEFFHHNSRFWIVKTFRLLVYSRLFNRLKIVLIQYVPDFHSNPSIRILEFLQKNNVEILKIWLDSYSDELWDNRINRIANIGKTNIIIDTPQLRSSKFSKDNSYFYLPIPVKSYPVKPFSERTFFLYYSGGIEENGLYKPRKEVLDYLELNNFIVDGTQYDRKNPGIRPDYETYRANLANSFIGLNFTWKGDQNVLVTRTWEILASGVLLLQNKSNLLDGLFTPGVHFLEFSSNLELLTLLNKLNEDRQLINKIAMAGKQKYEDSYSNEVFWNKTINYTD